MTDSTSPIDAKKNVIVSNKKGPLFKVLRIYTVLMCFLSGHLYASANQESAPKIINFNGSSTVTAYCLQGNGKLLDLRKADINITTTNSGIGFNLLNEGKVDVAMISAPIAKLLPKADAKNADSKFTVYPFSSAEVIFVVKSDLPTDKIKYSDIRSILSGGITNWEQLGLPFQKITVITPQETGAMVKIVKKTVLNNQPYGKNRVIVQNGPQVPFRVSLTPGSIGFMSSITPEAIFFNTKVLEIENQPELRQSLAFVTRKDNNDLKIRNKIKLLINQCNQNNLMSLRD